jgi:hypothetical protein
MGDELTSKRASREKPPGVLRPTEDLATRRPAGFPIPAPGDRISPWMANTQAVTLDPTPDIP